MYNVNLVWILLAFAAYMALMIIIGAMYMRRTRNSADYFLGGRGLSGWVAALSAQASDMSGWLLMGLPGSVYAFGTGQIWIAVGLFIGTVLNWICISGRLRKYTIKANNSLTLPEFFQNRYKDDTNILLGISSVVIVIFFVVYTASALASGGKLFNIVLGVDYRVALTIGAVVILAYTFMGGFMAVCTTDFVQGLLMLVGLLAVPLTAYGIMGPDNLMGALASTNPAGGVEAFMDIFSNGGKPITFIEILSQLAWGLGYCGMPHILVRFMAVRSEKELKKSRVIAIVWVALSLFFGGIVIGVIGRGYLAPTVLGTPETSSVENVFIIMIEKVFTSDIALPFVGGVFLCGILAAIMSTADSQLLVASSSVAEDIYKGIINPKADDRKVLTISRVVVIVVAVIAYVIALDPDSSIMGLVSNAWAGFGSAFGPLVVCSLFWKRTNKPGAIAGMLSGALTVIIWDYIPLAGGATLGTSTGIYSLLIGFFVSLICIVIVSLATKAPSDAIVAEFEEVASVKDNE